MNRRGRIRPVKEYLSPDLCREILCRLPVKDLLRFRLVCKTWRFIIEDPQFVSFHLTHYKNNVEGSRLIVLARREGYCPIIRRSDTFRKIGMSGTVDATRPYELPHIVGYINGLFVLWFNHKDTVTVWNPSIRRHFTMPPFPGPSTGSIRLGFGFDPSTNGYKVVSVCQRAITRDSVTTIESIVYLYTFESGSWKVISSGNCFPFLSNKNAFNKGIIYWATRDDFVLFDMGKEAFSCCNAPDCGSIVMEKIPVIFGESLALLTDDSDHLCLWVRDQYANWIKLRTINIEVHRFFIFMCVKMNGEMLFRTDKGVCSYNIKTHELKVLAKSYHGHVEWASVYVESLVWPIGV